MDFLSFLLIGSYLSDSSETITAAGSTGFGPEEWRLFWLFMVFFGLPLGVAYGILYDRIFGDGRERR
jgi:hypothetical protein